MIYFSLDGSGEAAKPDLLDHLSSSSSVDREQAENARNLAESARLAAHHQNGETHANGALPEKSGEHQNNGEVEKGSLEGDLSEKDSLSLRISCDETSSSSSVLKQTIQR